MTTGTDDPTTEQQPLARTAPVRRLADKKLAGVAAGLADHFSIDPLWVRLAFVLACFAGGIGIVAYIALWILMPASTEPAGVPTRGPSEIAVRFGSSTLGTVVIVVGILILGTQIFDHRPGLFWGLALVVLGLWLFLDRDPDGDERDLTASHIAPPVTDAPPQGTAAEASGPGGQPPSVTTPLAPPPRARPSRRRERSVLGTVTLGVLLVTLGIMWMVDVNAGASIRMVQYFAAALLIIGIALLIGTWYGRARWLIVLGIFLLPTTIFASAVTLPLEGAYGDVYVAPDRWTGLESSYRLAAGELRIDLRDVPGLPMDGTEVTAEVTFGTIEVYLPQDLPVDVIARVDLGELSFARGQEAGVLRDERSHRFGPAEGPAALTLDLHASVGSVRVWQVEGSGR